MSPKENDPAVSDWIQGAQQRDPGSEQALWDHYFQKVVRLARGRMFALQGSVYDEEDAAASALRSLFRGLHSDRFPALNDRHDLWQLLVLITKRKLRAQWRRETANCRTPQVTESDRTSVNIEEIVCPDPTPEFVASLMDETERMLGKLADDTLRRIVLMRLEGYSQVEIAEKLDCTRKTIQRKLEIVRRAWQNHE